MNRLTRLLLLGSLASVLTASASLHIVSQPMPGRTATLGDSLGPELSADGKWMVFSSSGNGLATNDNNGFTLDLFLRDNATGQVRLITRGTDGGAGDQDSYDALVTADGLLTVFTSDATNLVPEDDNESTDIFLYDRSGQTLTLLSLADGSPADGSSDSPLITPDGRFVLFRSDATNLAKNDENEMHDLFLLDRENETIELITHRFDGPGSATAPFAGENDFSATVSDDARYVAFRSFLTNHAEASFPELSVYRYQIYLRDSETGQIVMVSKSPDGVAGSHDSLNPVLSANGNNLAFLSAATNLTVRPENPQPYSLFVYNVSTETLMQVTYPAHSGTGYNSLVFTADGRYLFYEYGIATYRWDTVEQVNKLITSAEDGSPLVGLEPSISADGKVMTFLSDSLEYGGAGSVAAMQLYMIDPQTSLVRLLSADMLGQPAESDIVHTSMAADGKTVAFATRARNLTANDDKNAYDIFIVSVESAPPSVILASTPAASVIRSTANGRSNIDSRALSADGRFVVFFSNADDLAPGDDNIHDDVFLRDLHSGITVLVSKSALGTGAGNLPSTAPAISPDGQAIVYLTYATNLVANMGGYGMAVVHYDVAAGTNRILATTALDRPPRPDYRIQFSSDSKHVVYATSESLNIENLETGAKLFETNRLFFNNYFLTHNAEELVYTEINTFVRNLASGTVSSLPDSRTMFGSSEDGEKVLFRVHLSGQQNGLVLYDRTTGTTNLVTRNSDFGVLSADGTRIVYMEGGRFITSSWLVHLDLATGATNTISLPDGRTNFLVRQPLAITPDGTVVAFVVRPDAALGEVDQRLYIYDHAQRRTVQVGTHPDEDGSETTPSISADGDVVAFESSDPNLVPRDLNTAGDVFIFHRLKLRAAIEQDQFVASWRAQPGTRYQLQRKAELGAAAWENVGDPKAGSGILTHTLLIQNGGLYRLQVVP